MTFVGVNFRLRVTEYVGINIDQIGGCFEHAINHKTCFDAVFAIEALFPKSRDST